MKPSFGSLSQLRLDVLLKTSSAEKTAESRWTAADKKKPNREWVGFDGGLIIGMGCWASLRSAPTYQSIQPVRSWYLAAQLGRDATGCFQ